MCHMDSEIVISISKETQDIIEKLIDALNNFSSISIPSCWTEKINAQGKIIVYPNEGGEKNGWTDIKTKGEKDA